MLTDFKFDDREASIDLPHHDSQANFVSSVNYFEAKSFVSDELNKDFELFARPSNRRPRYDEIPAPAYIERETMSASGLSSLNSQSKREAK
jgi:hypothetical protein